MRTLIAILVLAVSLCLGGVSFAGKGGNHGGGDKGDKGPSERAYERANENASFKRGDDWEPPGQRKKHEHEDGDREHHKKDKHKHKKKDKDHDGGDDEHEDEDHHSDQDDHEDDVTDPQLNNQTGG